MTSVVHLFVEALSRSGVDLEALGLAWARVLPAVTLVPAFGLRALPAPARPVMALAMAASILPSVVPAAASSREPWIMLAVVEAARGLPVALAAAVPLWAATMTGGLADALRGAPEAVSMPTVEWQGQGRTSPLGVLLSLLACSIFLATGGPARIALALARPAAGGAPVRAAIDTLVSGITLAVALGGPLLAASVVIEVAAALLARATSPTQIAAVVAPFRTLAILAVFAVLLERIVGAWLRAL